MIGMERPLITFVTTRWMPTIGLTMLRDYLNPPRDRTILGGLWEDLSKFPGYTMAKIGLFSSFRMRGYALTNRLPRLSITCRTWRCDSPPADRCSKR